MKTNYLLPNNYKKIGWLIFVLGIIGGIFLLINDYESDLLTIKVFSIYYEPIIDKTGGFFKIIENSILDELVSLAIIIGGLFIIFSKEKVEDEFIYKLRKDSLAWAIIVNYIVLAIAIVFIYGLTFFHVLVFNIFFPLLFFIIRFTFLKYKYCSNEE